MQKQKVFLQKALSHIRTLGTQLPCRHPEDLFQQLLFYISKQDVQVPTRLCIYLLYHGFYTHSFLA